MTLPTWSTVFVDTQSLIPASFLNAYVRTQIPKAVDGVGGGNYAPAVPIEIQGTAGLRINGTGAAANLRYGSRSGTRQQALIATTTSGNWSRATTPRGAWQNTATGGTLDVHLDRLCHDAVLDRCIVRWIGAAGHGAFPGGAPVMPSWTIRSIDQDGVEATVATATDTSASAGAYEAAHSISNLAIAHTVNLILYRYVLTMSGETGANFIANAKILQVSVAHTITSQPEY